MSSSCVFVSLSSWANFSSLKKRKKTNISLYIGSNVNCENLFSASGSVILSLDLFSCTVRWKESLQQSLSNEIYFRESKLKRQKCRQMLSFFIINRKAFNGEIASPFGTTQPSSQALSWTPLSSVKPKHHPNCALRCHRKSLIAFQTSRRHRQKRRLRDWVRPSDYEALSTYGLLSDYLDCTSFINLAFSLCHKLTVPSRWSLEIFLQ